MYYQHLRAKKLKSDDLPAMQKNLTANTKAQSGSNLFASVSEMNHAIENMTPTRLNARVQERIEQLHLKRRLRFDAIVIEDIVVGTSSGFMQNAAVEQREQYFLDALHFFQCHYGRENVMYCQCHANESNPHIHVGIIPVTADGRLSASELFTDNSLKVLRTEFHREVASKYGLARHGEYHLRKRLEQCNVKMRRLKSKLARLLSESMKIATVGKRSMVQRYGQEKEFSRI